MGDFLYYARAVNPKMLATLNSIATEQANSKEATAKAVTQLINYGVTHSEAIKIYHVSGMTLHIHSNASFLSEPGAKIRAGGYHYLSTSSEDPNNVPLKQPSQTGPVYVECTTMRNFLDSAMEAEVGALL